MTARSVPGGGQAAARCPVLQRTAVPLRCQRRSSEVTTRPGQVTVQNNHLQAAGQGAGAHCDESRIRLHPLTSHTAFYPRELLADTRQLTESGHQVLTVLICVVSLQLFLLLKLFTQSWENRAQ